MTTLPQRDDVAVEWPELEPSLRVRPEVAVSYQPILDVARGIAAGYQAVAESFDVLATDAQVRRRDTVTTLRAALAAASSLPTNTFISIPVALDLVDDRDVRRLLRQHGDLRGIVLDITDFDSTAVAAVEPALQGHRSAGAKIAVGGHETAQPELGSIVRLRPDIIRLGAAWTRDIDQHPSRRSAIEVTGQLAGQLDAWILADDVSTSAELRTLAELGVPLARGPFIGAAQADWAEIGHATRTALPPATHAEGGPLRALLQRAYTTHDAQAAQAVLPDASGFECVVVVDERSHPVSMLVKGAFGRWEPIEVLSVNVDTPVADAVSRSMARPHTTRFSPITCTDAAGRFVGILRIERLMQHLVEDAATS